MTTFARRPGSSSRDGPFPALHKECVNRHRCKGIQQNKHQRGARGCARAQEYVTRMSDLWPEQPPDESVMVHLPRLCVTPCHAKCPTNGGREHALCNCRPSAVEKQEHCQHRAEGRIPEVYRLEAISPCLCRVLVLWCNRCAAGISHPSEQFTRIRLC